MNFKRPTLKAYNTLLLKYEILQEDFERKIIELHTQKMLHKKRQEVWEKALKEQEEEIIKLKRRKRKNEINQKK